MPSVTLNLLPNFFIIQTILSVQQVYIQERQTDIHMERDMQAGRQAETDRKTQTYENRRRQTYRQTY